MQPLTLEQIADWLSDRNLAEVARRTELHVNTVGKYARREVSRPDHRTVMTLSAYLVDGEAE